MFAVFLIAMFTGFVSKSSSHAKSGSASRLDVMQEMGRILKTLSPLLKPEILTPQFIIKHPDLSEELETLASLGIIKSFPDGSWGLEKPVTRGEGVYYFDQLLSMLVLSMKQSPMVFETVIPFSDIGVDHWLRKPMAKLIGMGAIAFVEKSQFKSDLLMRHDELKRLSSAFIEYLSSNLLLIIHDGQEISVATKGALNEISMQNWSFSFNEKNWKPLPENGKIIPEFGSTKTCRIFFRHPDYYDAGPIQLYSQTPALGSIKLQRNYSTIVKELGRPSPDKTSSTAERDRIRQRIEQLKARKTAKTNEKIYLESPESIVQQAKIKSAGQNASETETIESALPVNLSDYSRKLKPSQVAKEAIEPEKQQEDIEFQDPEFAESSSESGNAEDMDEQLNENIKTCEVKIVNALTGKGLAKAMLIIDGSQFTTNHEGKVSFQANLNSVIDLTAYCEGFEALQLKQRAGYREGAIKISLKPVLINFSGKVTCKVSGAPVARALIKMGEKATLSGKDGSFTINGAQEGYQQFSCFADKYMEAHEIVYVQKSPESTFKMELRPVFTADASLSENDEY